MSSKSAEFKDYYRVLDLTPSASEADIKNKYRELIKFWHPDKHEGGGTEYSLGKSQQINEAYAVLKDKERRDKYDLEYQAQQKKRAEIFKSAGNEAYKAMNFVESIRLYSEAIGLDQSNSVYYSNRSMAFGGVGDWVSARADAERSVQMNPNYIKGYYNHCRALFKLGDIENAQLIVSRGLSRFPGDGDLLRLRSEISTWLEEREQVKEDAFLGRRTREDRLPMPSVSPPESGRLRSGGRSSHASPYVYAPSEEGTDGPNTTGPNTPTGAAGDDGTYAYPGNVGSSSVRQTPKHYSPSSMSPNYYSNASDPFVRVPQFGETGGRPPPPPFSFASRRRDLTPTPTGSRSLLAGTAARRDLTPQYERPSHYRSNPSQQQQQPPTSLFEMRHPRSTSPAPGSVPPPPPPPVYASVAAMDNDNILLRSGSSGKVGSLGFAALRGRLFSSRQ